MAAIRTPASARLGHLTESFVVTELMKVQTWSRQVCTLCHYRTHAQREVDVVLEARDGHLVGIEVKASSTVTPADLAGLQDLAAATGDRFLRGIVLYLGDTIIPFGPHLYAVPLSTLWSW